MLSTLRLLFIPEEEMYFLETLVVKLDFFWRFLLIF